MTPDHLRELATRLQDYRDLIDSETVWPRPHLADAAAVANDWGTQLIELGPAADEALDPDDKLVGELRRLQVIAERMQAVVDPDEALRLLLQCNPRLVGSQNNWPQGRCKQIKDVLRLCIEEIGTTVSAHRALALADLLRHVRDFTLAYADTRRHDGEATFQDLLTRARDLLRDNAAVRHRAQGRFDRVFVDEFQDTDPLQVEIAWFLTSRADQAEERDWKKLRLEPGKLFIVGDPKQSIYRFRRADIGIYHQVYAQLERESNRVFLSQSFRSPAPLVDWFNFHFQDDMQLKDGVQPAYARLDPRPASGVASSETVADFGVRHFGEHVDTAGERWSVEAQSVAQLAHQVVEGSSPWSVADSGILRPARYSDMEFIRNRMLAVQAFGSAHPRDSLRRLRYVVAQARTLAGSGQPTLRALCDWLESRQRENYYDAESAVPDADEHSVRFMTVHGSKGLEFSIVILTGLGVATSRVGPHSVDLVPNYKTNILEVRCGDFTTSNYVRDTEKAMYEAEQKRLLYVATTRARDHLVLSLYHGKDACHASRILARLRANPELSREVTIHPIGSVALSSSLTRPVGVLSPATDSRNGNARAERGTAAAQHRADEDAWLAHRQSVIASLSDQKVISPSHLAHEPAQAEPDPPPEPDPNNVPRRIRKGRGGSALGRAVHAVLQTIDLATLADLDLLAESAASEENVLDHLDQLKQYVRNAAASRPVQQALSRGRYWREVPVGILQEDDSLLEGAIDLLYEHEDGTLGVVDYKTDQISEGQVAARAEAYRA